MGAFRFGAPWIIIAGVDSQLNIQTLITHLSPLLIPPFELCGLLPSSLLPSPGADSKPLPQIVHVWAMPDSLDYWTGDSNAPRTTHSDYFAQKADFAGSLLGAILYGMPIHVSAGSEPVSTLPV